MKKVKEQTIPRLSWLNGKTRPSSIGDRCGISGHGCEHTTANAENASRDFATQVTLANAALKGEL